MPPSTKFLGEPVVLAEYLSVMPEAAAVVLRCTNAVEAFARLRAEGLALGAVRLAAHALPPREAVWWACMAADFTAPAERRAGDSFVREAAEAWVRQRTDEARRKAMEAAQAAGPVSPEAWAGVGAFWSGGSMAPEGQPVVPPPPHLCGTAVAGAVLLASVRGDASRQAQRLELILDSAHEIAEGGAGRLQAEHAGGP